MGNGFFLLGPPRGYTTRTPSELEKLVRVEVGSNTSTLALRVVGGDEKGTQCMGDINTGTWPFRLGKCRI
jgi:hypothetical protein